jgi:hypothetical protein
MTRRVSLGDVLEKAVTSRRWRLKILCDKDRDDKCVDGDDTGHDNWDEALRAG